MILLLLAAYVAVVLATPISPWRDNGCGKYHPVGFNNDSSTNSLQIGNYSRTWGVNVPNSYNGKHIKRWPVIFDYHGSGGTSYTQYLNSMYFNYTQGQEYLVVYPQGVGMHWQGPNYSDPHANDLKFTTKLLQHIESTFCIDPSRVYASGKSNGAGFVDTLACSDNGDDFAAFAMASAALYTDLNEFGCTKKRAMLESHGDLDTTIPYHPVHDGSGGPIPDISQWVSWVGRRTCGEFALPTNSGDCGGFNTTWYSCGDYKNVVGHYQIFDLGHCWPSSSSLNNDATRNGSVGAHCLDKALDWTPVVLDFFGKWTLRNAPKNHKRFWIQD